MTADDLLYYRKPDMSKEDYERRVNYWRELFNTVEYADMDELFNRFYKSSGIHLTQLNIRKGKPQLDKNKDIILKRTILKRKKAGDMLIVAFWNGKFAFNLGLSGFDITGIEPYKKAVELANKTRDTLLSKDRTRFRFEYGFAEFLEEYPKFDIIVNFCLEHVKNPKHVVEEALRHLKPDGYAYFTPPIKQGCGSPEHIQWFDTDKELQSLIPRGYQVNIQQVKFMKETPFNNCFIMEVWH